MARFAVEELRNADLLRERGDIIMAHQRCLVEAEGCYKKVGEFLCLG